jgi:ribosomal-protein-alanine N-acetyltransferase
VNALAVARGPNETRVIAAADETTRVQVIETGRLILRRLHEGDAPFIFELVNDPAWLRYIGDKGVRTLDDARNYIRNGPMAMYAQHGFGLYCVELRENAAPIGVCGLLKRNTLPDADIGFAFLPAFRAQGFARESAAATLDYARQTLSFERVVAIVSPDNQDSARLLEKIGFHLERAVQLTEGDPVNLFAIDFGQAGGNLP